MQRYEKKLRNFMEENKIIGEHLQCEGSTHTVEDACREANAQPDDIVKTICMIAYDKKTIIAIVLDPHRASTERVAKVLGIEKPRLATPEEVLDRTGYPVGGTPPFGYDATFLIDPKVMEKRMVYVGGGCSNAIVRIDPREIRRINGGTIARVRK